jgi:outer membrane protein TolC
MHRTIVIALALLAALAMGLAEPVTYDLPAVITRALEANPTIKASREQVTAAEAKVEEARAARRPKVNGEAGYLQLAKDPSFTVPSMGSALVFGTADNPWANISMDWPIYSGKMIDNMIAASRQGVDAAWQGYARTRQETAAEAATAYYQVLSARQMVEVMQAQVATLTEAVRVATGLHDQGIVAKLDVLRPTSDLASARTMLTQAENGVQLATANLKRILNLPPDADIVVAPTATAVFAPAAAQSEAMQTALATRPEVKQLQAALRATEAQREIARAGTRPQVGMHAQYDFERQTTYPHYGSWSVAVVARQSLFDGGTAKAQTAAADAQRDTLRAQEEALTQGITLQVTQAVLNLQMADNNVQSATLAKTTAEEAYTAAVVSYKNQVVPMIDVLAAQTALTQARTQLALAEFTRQTALVQYHLALGDTPAPDTK